MRIFGQRLKTVFGTGFAVLALLVTSAAYAQGNGNGNGNGNAGGNGNGNGNAGGKNKNIGVGNASDGIMGRILTDKGIFYTGDPLDIGLKFARGAELITGGEVDAFVVIFAPTPDEEEEEMEGEEGSESEEGFETEEALTDAVVLPVSDVASEEEQKLFELEAVDTSTLPAGTYQLGLILTIPGGDPLLINDWHNGLLGLIDVRGLTITDEAVDFDEDGDGEVDDDEDGDGFSDDDDDEEEEEEG